MKRNFRSSKFAEYLSTYAIANRVGLHPTTLIEMRDATRGMGIFARDACDEGTTLIVVPSTVVLTSSNMLKRGVAADFSRFADVADRLNRPQVEGSSLCLRGVLTALLGNIPESHWIPFAARLAIELSARHSPWWGWLSSVPSWDGQGQAERLASKSRLVSIAPRSGAAYLTLEAKLNQDIEMAHQLISKGADDGGWIVPTIETFRWACYLLLSRCIVLPRNDSIELGIVPFVDLCNAAITIPRQGVAAQGGQNQTSSRLCLPHHSSNAVVEFATFDELPDWYKDEWCGLPQKKQEAPVHSACEYVLLTLSSPLRAGEEALLDYWCGDVNGLAAHARGVTNDNETLSVVATALRYSIP